MPVERKCVALQVRSKRTQRVSEGMMRLEWNRKRQHGRICWELRKRL